MQNAFVVRHRKRLQNCRGNVESLFRVQLSVVVEQFAEGNPGKELHDEIQNVALVSLVKHGNDIGVSKTCGLTRLANELCRVFVVVDKVLVHDLHGDFPLQPQVRRAVNLGHSAACKVGFNQVTSINSHADESVVC